MIGRASSHCAGASIFRANVCKSADFRLPRNTKAVFDGDAEFAAHHLRRPVEREEVSRGRMAEFVEATTASASAAGGETKP